MRFQVPQFIETETKLVGPFTLRQFLYIGSASALIFILQFVVSSKMLIVLAIILLGLAFALAYLKINDMPLPRLVVTAIGFLLSDNTFQYDKESVKPED